MFRNRVRSVAVTPIDCYRDLSVDDRMLNYPLVSYAALRLAHSIVLVGLLVTSYTTGFAPFTSLMIRVATAPKNVMSSG
jgi:hypothetical protein